MTEAFLCPLCGNDSCEHVLILRDRIMRTTDESFALVRCRDCGLMRLHPQPDGETLEAAYSSEYAPHVRSGLSGRAKSVLERRSARILSGYLAAPKRVLDVGCARGDLLAAIRARGNPNVTGVETSEQAVSVARSRGLSVVQGELDDGGFSDASFDTVLLSHTLEHVPNPVEFLREVNRVLAPGGALVLWLPNADSLEAQVFGRYWIGYDAPRHLTTFTAGTLGRTLSATGFDAEEIKHEWIGLEWAWGLRLLARDYVPGLEPLLRRLHPALIVGFTPLAILSARLRRSGRIRVIARKQR